MAAAVAALVSRGYSFNLDMGAYSALSDRILLALIVAAAVSFVMRMGDRRYRDCDGIFPLQKLAYRGKTCHRFQPLMDIFQTPVGLSSHAPCVFWHIRSFRI
jgi:hypothetical protein